MSEKLARPVTSLDFEHAITKALHDDPTENEVMRLAAHADSVVELHRLLCSLLVEVRAHG